MYSYAWTADPIVYGFIPESGSVSIGSTSTTTPTSGDPWYKVSAMLGCGDHTAQEKTLSCMRAKPSMQDILNANKKLSSGANAGMTFRPRADGKVVFADYAARLASGDFIKAPILTGNTDDEGGLSTALAAAAGETSAAGRPMTKRQANPLAAISCGPHAASVGRMKSGVSAWRYVYKGVYLNQDIGSKGAWHGSDIGPQFGATEFLSHRPDTPEERQMVDSIMSAWTAFAKDPKDGLKRLGWPLYDPEKPTVIALGGKNDGKVRFVDRAEEETKDARGLPLCK